MATWLWSMLYQSRSSQAAMYQRLDQTLPSPSSMDSSPALSGSQMLGPSSSSS